ncbi:BMP family ABC transporter substrate-binding protein [soil metagenome]
MKSLLLSIFSIAVLLSFSACNKTNNETEKPTSDSKRPLKVGLVFDVGGRGDKSFNDAAYNGLEKAKKELGIEFEAIDPGEGSDRESALRKLANKPDIGLIFGIGFIFTEDITTIAKEFKDKKFGCVDYSITPGAVIPDNLIAIEFREEEGSFLVGTIAALTSKTNKVGFIGGMESTLIKKFESGYKQGVKFGNPNCDVLSGYVSVTGDGFKNPGKAKEIANSQFSNGADVIYHASGLSGLGLFEAAREKKKLAIGVDMDQYKEAPGFVLTSMVKKVDEAIFTVIKDMKENNFKGGIKTLGLKENGVDYVYDSNNNMLITEEVRKKAEDTKARIISGEIRITGQ